MSAKFFSQAGSNFKNPAQGRVNARTGQFTVSLKIGDLIANNGMGPKLPLTIEYVPFDNDNVYALGIGCSLGLSHYDRANLLLTTSSGEQYKTIESGDGSSVSIKQRNAENFLFLKISDIEYRHISKSGEVEILSSRSMSPNCFVPIQIITDVGYQLNLTWQANGEQNQLITVRDEKNTLCEFMYDPTCKIRVFPDSSEEYQITLGTQNKYLSEYKVLTDSDTYTWSLEYTTVGGETLLTRITDPSGYVEHAVYTDAVMQFPPGANMPALPAVTQYVQSPGMSQPDTTVTYDYSNYNYLGYGIANSWDAEKDNSCTVLSDTVFYTSTETISDTDGTTRSTIRKFNNYHMLVTETIVNGNTSKKRETNFVYYAKPGVEYEEQPPQFQQPTSRTMTWTEGDLLRTETVDTTYDEYGNHLTKKTTGKESTEWTYYSAAGEAGNEYTGCPPDPYGFVTNVKTKTVTPAPSELNDFSEEQTQFKYTSFKTRSGSPADSCPLLSMTTKFRDGIKLQSNGITYDSTDSSNYGRVASVANTLISDTPGYTLALTYEIQQDALKQTAIVIGYDNTQKTKSVSHSVLTNRLLSEQDSLGNTTEYTYDHLGRPVSRVLNPGTPYENEITISYDIKKDPTNEEKVTDILTTYRDSSGSTEQIHYDGRHRPIRLSQNSIDSGQSDTFFDIAIANYNAFGHPADLTTKDYADPLNLSPTSQQHIEFLYDDWGNREGTRYDSGQTKYQRYDPVTLTQTEQLTDNAGTPLLGAQVTTFDVNKNPLKVERKDLQQTTVSTTTYVYDGSGRQRQYTDEVGNITTYDYDEFDRVSTETAPDATVVEKTYDAHSTESLIATIKVSRSDNQVELGAQTFDGLGRTTQSHTGGRTEISSYEAGNDAPATVTDNAGITLSYDYVPELQSAIRHVGGPTLLQDFTYDAPTGRPLDASEAGSYERSSQWTSAGRLLLERFTPTGGPQREASYSWTLRGKLLSYTDITGNVQQLSYDAYGRLSKIADEAVTVTFAYDPAGRLYMQKATDSSSGASLTTQLSYDDLGREVTRELAPSGGAPIVTITRTYYTNDQLQSCKTVQGSETLREEQYTYDNRNRLVDYSCTNGSRPPVDGYGQPIASQHFTFDMLDNVTECITAIAQGSAASDTATFHYDNPSDPTQLTSVTHAGNSSYPAVIELAYDANGRMTMDERGRTLTYDEAGRLASIVSPDGSSAEYHYDANDMLVIQILNGNDMRQLYYRGQSLVDEVRATQNEASRFIQTPTGCAAVSDESMTSP
ncbi:RHS repeat domain-containing protein [Paraburkholderia humisilvae]|uniref:Teneurin-like YD-shell domain-containing protein n=1 Tax=Paraburkholderia humisilvae TaxID=627669 RepID=A0A6J5DBS6_9BURK|nr:RHS repeat protein [Paraburkholderia humisilvae]CAB3751708.1 hypothetical protein LMG29542_01532 [Paraburkholderia humisilvae]